MKSYRDMVNYLVKIEQFTYCLDEEISDLELERLRTVQAKIRECQDYFRKEYLQDTKCESCSCRNFFSFICRGKMIFKCTACGSVLQEYV